MGRVDKCLASDERSPLIASSELSGKEASGSHAYSRQLRSAGRAQLSKGHSNSHPHVEWWSYQHLTRFLLLMVMVVECLRSMTTTNLVTALLVLTRQVGPIVGNVAPAKGTQEPGDW